VRPVPKSGTRGNEETLRQPKRPRQRDPGAVVLQELRVHHGTARVFAAQLQVVGYVLGLSQIPSLVAHTILTLFVHTHRLGQKRVGRLNRQHHRGLGTYFPFTTHRLCDCPYPYQKGLLPLTVYSYTLRETDTFLLIVPGGPLVQRGLEPRFRQETPA
jgi:hypothetical protein